MSDDHLEDSKLRDRLRRVLAARCRIAGGAQVGYSVRRAALEEQAAGEDPSLGSATTAAVNELVTSGRLRLNEAGDRVYLTESGVSWLSGDAVSALPAD